jgi:SAM-dependent methyltransferase
MKRHDKAKAKQFYDEYHRPAAAQSPDDPVVRRTYARMRLLLRQLKAAPGSRLLDLSCGVGQFLAAARDADASLELHGLDHSKVAVEETRRRVPSAKVRQGDAMGTPYAKGYFDTVTCIGSLEHYPDSARGLQEIYRILKPGGRAYVYVPNLFFLGYIYLTWKTGETPHEAGQNQYERFETRQGWEDLIKAAGFVIRDVTKDNEMYATNRVPALVKLGYRFLIEPLVPLNLSYCFGFWLEKPGHGGN